MASVLRDVMGIPNQDDNVENDQHLNGADAETKRFFRLLRDAETDLFPGCKKQTKLSFISRLLHLKVLCRWSNHSVNLLLKLLRDTFPDNVNLPANYYEANKITTELGFTCEVIDACPNNCMLFRGEDAKLDQCEICGEGRYKDEAKKVATKNMRWHAEERIKDGVVRHPADSQAWKEFDKKNPSFASYIRNVRLGLVTDGFNPHGMMNVSYSIWPVVLMTYNLPPWLCMKQTSFILYVIIDGRKRPGNKIDVFATFS
ncbi:UNVERIFIED_CONTAM: hypothetical protein Slati_3073100 [Sesamum latifolium]|uniref:Transposase n=1 Tax=Sesamum latifolium TaxID=2727402 RepID=A0AAW2UUP2_9LAMI